MTVLKGILKKQPIQMIFEVSQDTLKQIQEAHLLMVASSLAYTTLLSIIPFLALVFATFQTFGGMQKLYLILEPLILSYLAEGTDEKVITALHEFIENAHTGAVGISGFLGLIFTSMSMLFNVDKAFNQIWKVKIQKSLYQRISSYWLWITLGPLAFSIFIGISSSTPLVITRIIPSGTGILIGSIVFWFCIYQWVPHTPVKGLCALSGSLFTSTCLILARLGYSFYTKSVVTYHVIYGSLGAIPILLLWIYILWVIVLCGAALSATLQKRMTSI